MVEKHRPSVLIGIMNHSGIVQEAVAASRMQLVGKTKALLPDIEMELGLIYPHDIVAGRWELAKMAVALHKDFLFFLDADMLVPEHALYIMVNMNTDIVSGLGFTNSVDAPMPSLYIQIPEKDRKEKDKPYTPLLFYDKARAPVMSVDAVGLFCCLIKTSVFEKMAADHGSYIEWYNPFEREGTGEDFSFCRRAKESGFQVLVRTDVKCGHYPRWPAIIDEELYFQRRAAGAYGVVDLDASFNPIDADGNIRTSI
jgi:hypothetical protein